MTPDDLARVADIRARADAAAGALRELREAKRAATEAAQAWSEGAPKATTRRELNALIVGRDQTKWRFETLLHGHAVALLDAAADVPWLLDRLAAETERADKAEAAVATAHAEGREQVAREMQAMADHIRTQHRSVDHG